MTRMVKSLPMFALSYFCHQRSFRVVLQVMHGNFQEYYQPFPCISVLCETKLWCNRITWLCLSELQSWGNNCFVPWSNTTLVIFVACDCPSLGMLCIFLIIRQALSQKNTRRVTGWQSLKFENERIFREETAGENFHALMQTVVFHTETCDSFPFGSNVSDDGNMKK